MGREASPELPRGLFAEPGAGLTDTAHEPPVTFGVGEGGGETSLTVRVIRQGGIDVRPVR